MLNEYTINIFILIKRWNKAFCLILRLIFNQSLIYCFNKTSEDVLVLYCNAQYEIILKILHGLNIYRTCVRRI